MNMDLLSNQYPIVFLVRSEKMKKKQHSTIQMINYATNHIGKWINERGLKFYLAHSIEEKEFLI